MSFVPFNRRKVLPLQQQAASSLLKHPSEQDLLRSGAKTTIDAEGESSRLQSLQTTKKKHPDIKPPAQKYPAENILSLAKRSVEDTEVPGSAAV